MTAGHPLTADLDTALAQAETDLRSLAGSRLFLTGCTGFVGTWLLELLVWGAQRLNLDIAAVALTRSPASWSGRLPHLATSGVVTVVAGDVRSFTFPPGEFATAILGAASSDNAWITAHPGEVASTIETGTRRGLAFADAGGASRVLLLSSGAVYGRQPADLAAIPEDYAGQPPSDDAYAGAKRAAEALALAWSGGPRSAVVARVFNVYGPYQPLHTHFAIANFIADAIAGHPVMVRGDGSPVRSYLYGADLAVALLACLVRGVAGAAYNVGGSDPIRLGELADLVASLASPPVDVRVLGSPGVPAGRYVPDVGRIAADLGVRAAVPLADGVRRTMAFASRGRTARDPSVPGSRRRRSDRVGTVSGDGRRHGAGEIGS